MLAWLLLIWASARDRALAEPRDLWAGGVYRFVGDIESRYPLTADEIQRALFLGPVSGLQIGEKGPPYRIAFTIRVERSLRMQLPYRFRDPTAGVTIVLREITELRTKERQV